MSGSLPIVDNMVTEYQDSSDNNIDVNGPRTPQEVAGYVEFFPSTVPCPSCRGSGRIPKGLEEQMVALIPLNDNRLKPRRTWLYVSIAVTVCIAGAALMTYFLLPRDVAIENNDRNYLPQYVKINSTLDELFISLTASYNFTNGNFFPLTISALNVSIIYNNIQVGMAINKTVIIIPMRKSKSYDIQINITFSQTFGMTTFCNKTSTYGQMLFLPFTASADASYFGHTEKPSLTSHHYVKCSPTQSSKNSHVLKYDNFDNYINKHVFNHPK